MASNDMEAGMLDIAPSNLSSESAPLDIMSEDEVDRAGDDAVIENLLYLSGIDDPEKIKFAGDDGNLYERSWTELSPEEKMNIFAQTPKETGDSALSEDEVSLINTIRATGNTVESYIDAVRNQAVNEAIPMPDYKINEMTDDELFMYDAFSRYGADNLSDEEVYEMVTNAKSNPGLYAKTIETLRNEYQAKEDEILYHEQQKQQAEKQAAYNEFSENVLREIQSLRDVGGQEIELSKQDMNDLANFMLTQDDAGYTQFGRLMNDPHYMTRMALWAMKGDDIMGEMSSQIRAAYNRGVQEARSRQSQLAFSSPRPSAIQKRSRQPIYAAGLDVK